MARQTAQLFLELGSSRFKLVALVQRSGSIPEIFLWTVAAQGVRRGDVVDAMSAASSLESLLATAEATPGIGAIRSCKLMIPGNLLQCRGIETRHVLSDDPVQASLEAEMLDALSSSVSDDGAELIDLAIQSWVLDGASFTDFPVGRRGRQLTLSAFGSFCEPAVLSRLIQVCNNAGVEIATVGAANVASAKFVGGLFQDSSNRVFYDVGHSSCSVLLQVGGRFNSSFHVNAGSHHMTRDIAAALQCDLDQAERLKRNFGISLTQSNVLALPPAGGQPPEAALDHPTTIYPWLAPRVIEMLMLGYKRFALYSKALDGGVVLIGGGSLLTGMTAFASQRWDGLNVTRFKPSCKALAASLGITVHAPSDESLYGCEGVLGASIQSLQNARANHAHGAVLKSPKFLRPLFTWFAELAR